MTAAARKLLDAFEAIALPEEQEAAAEILRRPVGVDPLPDACFDELAAELFRGYDAEEAARASH